MKVIKKNSEPPYLLQHRKNKRSNNYDLFYNEKMTVTDKISKEEKEVRLYSLYMEHLLEEQGHICAYCMRRIPNKQMFVFDEKIKEKKEVTLEHWYPQHGAKTIPEQIDIKHSNMIAVCSGNQGLAKVNKLTGKGSRRASEVHTCDTSRKKGSFLVVNPQEENHINLIKYTISGLIFSFDLKHIGNQELIKKYVKKIYESLLNSKGVSDQKKYPEGSVGKEYKRLEARNLKTGRELNLAIHFDLTVSLNLNETDLKEARAGIFTSVKRRTLKELKKCRSREEKTTTSTRPFSPSK